MNAETGQPEWLCVNTGLFGTSESFVPLRDAQFKGDTLYVAYTKNQVKNAPNIDPAAEGLGVDQVRQLYSYYGRLGWQAPEREASGGPGGPTERYAGHDVRGVDSPSTVHRRRGGTIADDGVRRLVEAVGATLESARNHRVAQLIPFATSAVRDATNSDDIRQRLEDEGITAGFLSGDDEARLTFFAAHRWLGWSAGPLLLLDMPEPDQA